MGLYCVTWIDSHAHLTTPSLLPIADELLVRAAHAGVSSVVNICTDAASLEAGLALAKQPGPVKVYNVASTTPHDVEKEGESVFPIMEKAARTGALVAVGETGLDYYYEHSPKELQKTFLRRYLHLALECHLPVVIHCREAFADFFEILDAEYRMQGAWAPGVLHCFTGSLQEAHEVIRRGWYLSLSGIVTFKKSEELQKVAQAMPLEQLLIETDAPYLAPQSHRGKVNEPAFLPEVGSLIAKVKGILPEEVALATSQNARRLFHLS